MAPVTATMAAPTTPLTTVRAGCRAFNFVYKVPDAEQAGVDAFFAEHKAFMDETHKTSGDEEPVVLWYTVTKSPEPVDMNDPSKGVTGFQMYALCEVYKGMDGCNGHLKAGMARPEFFAKFNEIGAKYSVAGSMMGEVICSM